VQLTVSKCKKVAKAYKIPANEQDLMAQAFEKSALLKYPL
jgi:hypothetical protein